MRESEDEAGEDEEERRGDGADEEPALGADLGEGDQQRHAADQESPGQQRWDTARGESHARKLWRGPRHHHSVAMLSPTEIE